jgi:hypothetical protein
MNMIIHRSTTDALDALLEVAHGDPDTFGPDEQLRFVGHPDDMPYQMVGMIYRGVLVVRHAGAAPGRLHIMPESSLAEIEQQYRDMMEA